MKPGEWRHIAPGFSVMVRPMEPAAVLVPVADLQALRATARELLAITAALQASPGANPIARSAHGMARHIKNRLESL